MEFSWWAALYAQLGAPHLPLSLVVVAVLFGASGGGCWALIGADYKRQLAAREQIGGSNARSVGAERGFRGFPQL